MQADVEKALEIALEAGSSFDSQAVKAMVAPTPSGRPWVAIQTPNLNRYDDLLVGVAK
jgi:hypothetical protein